MRPNSPFPPIVIPELSYSPFQSSPADSDAILTPFFEHPVNKKDRRVAGDKLNPPPQIYCHSPSSDYRHGHYSSFDYSSPLKAAPLGPCPLSTFPDLNTSPQSSLSRSDKRPALLPTDSPTAHMRFNLDADRHSSSFPPGHKLNRYFVSKYQLEDELGSGGYGFVMTAKHRDAGYEVAVKFIIKDKVPEGAWMEDEMIGKLPTEVMLLSFIDHEGVVKCLDLFEDGSYFYLVQELHGSPWPKAVRSRVYRTASASCSSPSEASSTPSLSPSASVDSLSSSEPATPPQTSFPPFSQLDTEQLCKEWLKPESCKGSRPEFSRRPSHDLFECIEQSVHKRLSEEQARYVFAQVVDTVHYLDTNGIAHRDIKDENLVIDKDLKVKLIDFGSATIVDPNEPRPYYTLFYGTAAYASSEILRKKPYQAAPAEIWTLGVLLSFLLTGASPFPTVKDAIDGKVVLTDQPDRLSKSALQLMKVCLDPNPETRATIAQVKMHPWLLKA